MSEGPQTRQRGKVVLGRTPPPVPQTPPTQTPTGTPPVPQRRVWVNQTRVLVGLQPQPQTGGTTPQSGGTTPPPTVSSTPQTQLSPRGQQVRDEVQYAALYDRMESVKAWMQQVRQTHPEVFEKMIETFRAAGTELGEDNYGVAAGHLNKLELVIKKLSSGETHTPETTQMIDTDSLFARLQKIGQFLKTVEGHPGTDQLNKMFRETAEDFKQGRYDDCLHTVIRFENNIEKIRAKQSGTGPQVQPQNSGFNPNTTTTTTIPQSPPPTRPQFQPQNTGFNPNTTTTTTTTVPQTPPQTPPQGVGTGGPTTTTTTVPQTPPQRPNVPRPFTDTEKAKGKFDAAKRGVDAFTQDPDAEWNTITARKQINDRKQEMLTIVDSESNAEDDIQRKGIIFDSKDKDYHKNVTTLVKTTMASVRPALADPTVGTSAAIKTLNDAVNKLAVEKRYYANVKGITDRGMLDQRKRKTAAIDSHIKEMLKIVAKLQSILKIKYEPMLNLLDTLPELSDNDAGEAQTASRQFAALLSDDTAREEFFQAVGKSQADSLIVMLGTPQTEPLAKELAITRASDNDFMDDLCQKAVAKEGADVTDKGTFFRGNTLATKLAVTYTSNSPDGKAYCEETLEKLKGLLKGKGSMELDPSKAPDKEIAKNLVSNKKVLSDAIDDLSDPNSVPPELAKLSAQFYRVAQRVAPGDDEYATTQAGGFIVLRVINPELLQKLAEELNATNLMIDEKKKAAKQKWISSGKNADDFKYEIEKKDQATLNRIKEEQRATTMQTKVLMNIANGVEFGSKEKYMIPMNDSIKSGNGYAPPAAKFRKFLKDTADRGQKL